MSVLKQYYKAISASVLLAVAALGYLEFSGKKPASTVATEVRSPSPRNAQASLPPADPMALRSEQLERAAVRGLPPSSPEIQKLLPGIVGQVKNWKEFKPEKLVIAPYPDTPIEFEIASVREENGRTIWTGRNALEGAFLTAVSTENDWQATLVIPPVGAFDIQITGQTVSVLEKNHDQERCGTRVSMARDVVGLDSAGVAVEIDVIAATDTSAAVDVLFFYDAEALTRAGTQGTIDTRAMLNIESSNTALLNSGITSFHWHFLASFQVPAYTTTTKMEDDLDMITGFVNNQTPITPNPVSTFVSDKATLYGADQVFLYVGGSRTDASGIAWVANTPLRTTRNLAFQSAVGAWGTSYLVVAHELAHNFGCYHDRLTEKAADGDGLFHYGYRYADPTGSDYGTIMSYANFRVPYYSNPAITYNGNVLGVAADQPKAADNARVIRESASAMAVSRVAVDPPAITAQPQSVSALVGQSFTLSVTATGSNVTYQWKLAGVDLVGATSASFSKATAAATDAGSYTVVVSNLVGSVTSNFATVTITTPAPAPAASSGGGGGGGGGGTANVVFTIMCGLLFILRWKFKIRS